MQPGRHKISAEEYHKDPCPVASLSRGIIRELLYKTPAHVFASNPRLNPDCSPEEEKEDKFDIGTAAHSLFLEGINVAVSLDYNDYRSKEAQTRRDEAREAGKVPLLSKHYDRVCEMVDAAHKQLAASELGIKDLYKEGVSEETFIWKEGETWCRIRPDWRSNDFKLALDYKTTECADPAKFSSKVIEQGYDIQDRFYSRGMQAVTGIKPRFIFMVQEVKRPYLCSFIALPPEFAHMGEQKVQYGLFMWDKCRTTGEWPGYPKQVCYLDTPSYALAAWEQRAALIGE